MTLHGHFSRVYGRRVLLAVFAALLGFGLAACGGPQFMPSAQDDGDVGVVHNAGSDDTVSAPAPASDDGDDLDQRAPIAPPEVRVPRVSRHQRLSVRGGHGKLTQVAVRPGDTLWKIALRHDVYGSGWLYPLIYKANRALLPDPNKPKIGLLLKVPRDVPAADIEKAEEEAMTGQYLDQTPLPGAPAPAPAPAVEAQTVPAATSVPTSEPTPMPLEEPVHSRLGFGGAGWTLMFLVLAVLTVVAYMRLRPDETE